MVQAVDARSGESTVCVARTVSVRLSLRILETRMMRRRQCTPGDPAKMQAIRSPLLGYVICE